MVDPALVYVGGVLVLFFFWVYGIVAFLRDVKNRLVPAYRQWRRDDDRPAMGESGGEGGTAEEQYLDGDPAREMAGQKRQPEQ